MATAKRLPSGNWRVRVYIKGANPPYKSFTAPTKKQAEFEAAEYALKNKPKIGTEITFDEAAEEYINIKRAVLSPSTINAYVSLRKNAFEPIKNMRLCDITEKDVQSAVGLYSVGRSSKTIANMHGFMAGVLGMNRLGELVENTTLPKKTRVEIVVPTHDEVKKLIEYAKGHEPPMEAAIMLAAYCGLREGEVAGLSSECVFKARQTIRIQASLVRGEDNTYIEKGPKSVSGYRDVPCAKDMCELLLSRADGKYVVNMLPRVISDHFLALAKRAGVRQGVTFHTLRHYFCSNALLRGIPKLYLVELMGHSSSTMIDRVYAHTFADAKAEFAQRLLEPVLEVIRHEK